MPGAQGERNEDVEVVRKVENRGHGEQAEHQGQHLRHQDVHGEDDIGLTQKRGAPRHLQGR